MKKTMLLLLALIALTAWLNAPQAATEEEIETAIENGLAWLATQQTPDGSWPAYYGNVAVTALALIKFEDRAYELGYTSPFDPAYPYYQTVVDGWDFLLDNSNGFFNNAPIGVQDHTAGASGNMDNPDANGNGIGVYVYGNSGIDLSTYETGCVLAAFSASRTPTRLVNSPGSPIHGRQFQAIAQDIVEWLAWGQSDYHYGTPACGEGGWTYSPLNNSSYGGHGYGPDNSNSGYAVLGLAYAEDFGCNIPGWVLTELNAYVGCIQDPVNGDAQDGGSWYDRTGDGIGVNTLKTGNLIFEMGMVGDAPEAARVQNALDYLARHWGDPSGGNQPPGWNGDPAQYQAMFCIMKGLEFIGIDEFNGIDWFGDFSDAIVAQQIPQTDPDPSIRGAWLTSSGRGNASIITAWALLTLEKISPEGECEGINLWIPGDIRVMPGENVYVPIYIQDVTGWGVMAFEMEICWCDIPAGLLQYEFCDPGEVMIGSGWASPVCGPCDPNCMSISAAGATPLQGEGILLYLKFHVSENAKPCMCCDIWFTEVSLYDPEQPLQVCWEDGQVCVEHCTVWGYVRNWYCDYDDCGRYFLTHPIEGARLNLWDCNGPIASTFSDAEGAYTFDCLPPGDPDCVYSYCVDVDYCEIPRRLITAYDASLILQHIVCLDDLDDCVFHTCMTWAPQRIAADVNCSNVITAYDASLVLQYVVGILPAFPCPDPWVWYPSPCDGCIYGCFGGVDYIGVLKGNVSGAPSVAPFLPPVEAYVRLGHPRHAAGKVTVPVFVKGAVGVFSVEFDVLHDTGALEFDSVVAAGLTSGWALAERVSADSIIVALAGSASFTGDGRIATLTFNKKKYAPGVPVAFPLVKLDAVLFNEGTPAAVIEDKDYNEEIVAFGLGPVSPNPFTGRTAIAYALPAASHVSLNIYDVNGRLVRTVVDADMEAGTHRATWDGTDDRGHRVARGMYFCRMAAGEFSATGKVVLLQ
jgi:hypothetical protein